MWIAVITVGEVAVVTASVIAAVTFGFETTRVILVHLLESCVVDGIAEKFSFHGFSFQSWSTSV
jgi:hypothetical protein